MSIKVFRRRLFFMYSLIILTLSIYVIGKTYTYQLLLNQNTLSEETTELQTQLEEANMKINSLISREAIMKDYPELKLYSDNVFYLEPINEQTEE